MGLFLGPLPSPFIFFLYPFRYTNKETNKAKQRKGKERKGKELTHKPFSHHFDLMLFGALPFYYCHFTNVTLQYKGASDLFLSIYPPPGPIPHSGPILFLNWAQSLKTIQQVLRIVHVIISTTSQPNQQ